MTSRLADRLNAARHGRFVGRAGERALFAAALAAEAWPFSLLYAFGPGGVGKTALLHEFLALCDQAGIPAHYLDARNVEPSPDSFVAALQHLFGLGPVEAPAQALAARPARRVLCIDTYETLAPLDDWLRETFLPQLPEDLLVVLAGRRPAPLAWRADPGWQALVRLLPLRNLAPAESAAYLARREVPPAQHEPVLAFTHGHPLALSLVADLFAQRRDLRFEPATAPDVVAALLAQFVQKVPGPAHRAALEACGLVRVTTEALLAAMLDTADVHELFAWLRDLSFIEAGPLGLFPHDLAREALAADVRWRNPDWYAELHHRARRYYAARLQQTHGQEQQRVLFAYIYLHRDNPFMRPFLEWQETGAGQPDAPRDGDLPDLLAMVAAHEGAESARHAAHWLARQPGGAVVFRDAEQRPAGFVLKVALDEAGDDDLAADPATRAAWRYLAERAPLRPGERATFFRFWLARDTYQAVSAVQSLLFANVAQHYLTTPGLAFTFFPCADEAFWTPFFAHIDLPPLPEVAFAVGGRRYAVYGHDWRATPPLAWLDLLAARELATEEAPAPPAPAAPLVVLSRPEFAAAARDALRDLARPDALRANPLLRSRLVSDRLGTAAASPAERAAALRALVTEAVEALRATPRDLKLHRALDRTYLHPAPTQEQAAELLDLPFSTYRRHLKAGIERVTEALWQHDIGTAPR
ncbi:MAG TPA: ATP-binding protein [Thermomicrobiales bacterium]|nr:ATP-binding protein [Thermomicrobiales bacterium]